MQGSDPFGRQVAPDPRRVEARRTMTLSCLGCIGSALIMAGGVALVIAGLVVSEPLLIYAGVPVGALGLLGGLVSSIVNQFGFARDISARWQNRR